MNRSLIYQNAVIMFGEIEETETAFITDTLIAAKTSFPDAVLINDVPPSDGSWRYENGTFINLEEEQAKFNELAEKEHTEMLNRMKSHIRKKREQLLLDSDWTQVSDAPESIRLAWQPYRQALRDIPQQPRFPESVTWPEPPEA